MKDFMRGLIAAAAVLAWRVARHSSFDQQPLLIVLGACSLADEV